jgi:hypothetical protein
MKILLFSIILTGVFLRANSQLLQEIEEFNSLMLRTRLASGPLENKEIQGNPYSNEEMIPGTIVFVSGSRIDSISMRYNWYSNEMEFEHNGAILSLPVTRSIDYILLGGSKYVPFNYLKNIKGFMIELCRGRYSLFRREDVRFVEAIPPQSGYDQYQPAKFQWFRTQYLVITDSGDIIELDLNKKKLPSQFPDYKEKIEYYINNNKLNIKKESDLIKLFQMFNSNMQ